MNISFKEKSIWASLIITIIVFGYYFVRVVSIFKEPVPDTSTLIGVFITMVVLMIIIQIVSQITLAIAFKKEANEGFDERDKLISLKATRISYWILILGVVNTILYLVLGTSPLLAANILWFMFIIAEICGDSIKLFYYRRGI